MSLFVFIYSQFCLLEQKLEFWGVAKHLVLTIYAPMIYTAPCIMFWMRAYPLRGEVGGGWALEFSSFFWAL
jgi:hypothetical protein